MGQRLELQTLLQNLLGSNNVYFQPPQNVQMNFPCIVYTRDFARTEFADNKPYRHKKRYQVTHIGQDPDSPIPDKLAEVPMSTFERHFTNENLHHDVYTIFF